MIPFHLSIWIAGTGGVYGFVRLPVSAGLKIPAHTAHYVVYHILAPFVHS